MPLPDLSASDSASDDGNQSIEHEIAIKNSCWTIVQFSFQLKFNL